MAACLCRIPYSFSFSRVFKAVNPLRMACGGPLDSFNDTSGDSTSENESKDNYREDQRAFFSPSQKEEVLRELRTMSFGGTQFEELSRNAQKKLVNLRIKKKIRKMKKSEDKASRSGPDLVDTGKAQYDTRDEQRSSKKDQKRQQRERMREALVNGVKVAIDCSMSDQMSPKEICKLCRQINHAYGMLMRSEKPFHLYLTGLITNGSIHKECMRQCSGFENYIIDTTESLHYEAFPADSIIYMTPDSPNVLESLDKACVYVVGGLVDESLEQGLTYKNAEKMKLKTARLPVDVYMDKTNPGAHCVMAINQVIGILLDVNAGKEWSDVLTTHLPSRKGFVLKPRYQKPKN